MKITNIKYKQLLFISIRILTIFCMFINFFYFINKSNTSSLVPSCFFKSKDEYDNSTNVGSFIDNSNINTSSEISAYINDLFKTRNKSFINGNVENLYKFYDFSQTFSKESLLHEFKRIAYLRDWASERDIVFSYVESYPYIKNMETSGNSYNIELTEEYKFEYYYKDNPEIKNNFGIALFHNINLIKFNDTYKIIRDYYLDCFKDGLENYNFSLNEKQLPITKGKLYNIKFNNPLNNYNSNYNRKSSVEYANKYCGISWASDNMYNYDYYDYTAGCGNCTNFISQCLADNSEGGNLEQDRYWRYMNLEDDAPTVTSAWVSPEKFINYLFESNKCIPSSNGSFKNLFKYGYFTSSQFEKISAGDIVSYKKNSHIEHNAIITDFDSMGYPLVNSNSINKYKVPFDLGFNNSDISFQFIRIK